MKFTTRNKIKRLSVIIFWIVIWQIISMIFNEEILFVSPFKVFKTLIINLKTIEFYNMILHTFIKIVTGFSIGLIFGIILAIISKKFRLFKEVIYFPVLFLKSVPVVSFIVLLLFFITSENLPIWISGIMVFPIIYLNIYEGLENVNEKYIIMAKIYRVGMKKQVIYIYMEDLKPFIESAVTVASGLAFKSGIAAEVIALPTYGIGTKIYNSKIYLDTAELFAYTIVAIILAYMFEKILLFVLRKILF